MEAACYDDGRFYTLFLLLESQVLQKRVVSFEGEAEKLLKLVSKTVKPPYIPVKLCCYLVFWSFSFYEGREVPGAE